MSKEKLWAEKQISHITGWIQRWFEKNGKNTTAVIGISGGKDSTIMAALLARALGKERVLGVRMPNGEGNEDSDAQKVIDILGIPSVYVDIQETMGAITKGLYTGTGLHSKPDAAINIPPRIRMTILYAVAQSLPNGGRVINTGNRSEIYIGYCTKWGDMAGDVAPLADYTVTELIQIGRHLSELPEYLVTKTPSDGLCGKTDEERIGFTYETLDNYLLYGTCPEEDKEKIEHLHTLSIHKRKSMRVCPILFL